MDGEPIEDVMEWATRLVAYNDQNKIAFVPTDAVKKIVVSWQSSRASLPSAQPSDVVEVREVLRMSKKYTDIVKTYAEQQDLEDLYRQVLAYQRLVTDALSLPTTQQAQSGDVEKLLSQSKEVMKTALCVLSSAPLEAPSGAYVKDHTIACDGLRFMIETLTPFTQNKGD